MSDTFVPLLGFRDYEVNEIGQIRNRYTFRILKPRLRPDGYYDIRLINEYGEKITPKIHRITALSFGIIEDHEECDHNDGIRDNNDIRNLRPVNLEQQMHNKGKHSFNWKNETPTSKYKGVHWRKDIKKWRANIYVNGKNLDLGYFNTDIEGAKAYNTAAIQYYGKYAAINDIDTNTINRLS